MQGFKTSLIVVFFTLLVFVCACVPIPNIQKTTANLLPAPVTDSALPMSNQDQAGNQELLTSLYERVNPGVVAIRVQTVDQDSFQGSGFVYDLKGTIVTNYHVIENAQAVEVVDARDRLLHHERGVEVEAALQKCHDDGGAGESERDRHRQRE